MTFLVFNNSNGESMLNSTGTLLKDLKQVTLSYRLSPAAVSDHNVHNIIQGKIDPCKVQKGMFRGFMVRIIQESLSKYSNYKLQCSLARGFYYFTNMKIDDSNLPLHFLGQQIKFAFQYAIKGKISNQKAMVEVYKFKINGIAL